MSSPCDARTLSQDARWGRAIGRRRGLTPAAALGRRTGRNIGGWRDDGVIGRPVGPWRRPIGADVASRARGRQFSLLRRLCPVEFVLSQVTWAPPCKPRGPRPRPRPTRQRERLPVSSPTSRTGGECAANRSRNEGGLTPDQSFSIAPSFSIVLQLRAVPIQTFFGRTSFDWPIDAP